MYSFLIIIYTFDRQWFVNFSSPIFYCINLVLLGSLLRITAMLSVRQLVMHLYTLFKVESDNRYFLITQHWLIWSAWLLFMCVCRGFLVLCLLIFQKRSLAVVWTVGLLWWINMKSSQSSHFVGSTYIHTHILRLRTYTHIGVNFCKALRLSMLLSPPPHFFVRCNFCLLWSCLLQCNEQ